jgi:hypothetical protein
VTDAGLWAPPTPVEARGFLSVDVVSSIAADARFENI